MKKKRPLESEVQRQIMEYLAMQRDFYCWRAQNVPVYDVTRKSFRSKSKHEAKGLSDVLGIYKTGRMVAIEIKRPGATASSLRPDQKVFLEKIAAMGGASTWVTSVEQVQEFLNDIRLGKF